MNDLDDFVSVLRRVDDDVAPMTLGAVRARVTRQRRRGALATALVALVVCGAVATPALLLRQDRAAPQPGRTPVATALTRLEFAGVSVPVPASWSLHAMSSPAEWDAAACVGPANGTYTTETSCVGGLVISRQIRAIGAFSSTLPGRTYTCEIFGSLTSPVPPSVVSALPDPSLRLGHTATGDAMSVSWEPCRLAGTFSVSWRPVTSLVVLRAGFPLAPGVLDAVRGVRVAPRHLIPVSGPEFVSYTAQDHGVTVQIPPSWGFFSKAAECVGTPGDPDAGSTVTCPVNGVLVRGAPFFSGGTTGSPGVAGQGGAVTPDPWSPRGYASNTRKTKLDIEVGCARLKQVGLSTVLGAGTRVLIDQGSRRVAGHTAQYRAWRTTCSDGTTFTWRRWWLPVQRTMFDSYDMPGGLTTGYVDALLKDRTTID